jgi:antibiotic biosynthesis monooxygenase (ABM) superfamily enzyme
MSTSSSPVAAVQAAPHAGAVTVLVTRRIKPGMEATFEKLMNDMIAVARSYPGHLGAQLVRPGEQDDSEPGLYQVVFAFDSDAHLQAWKDSPARSLGLAAIEPLSEGPAQMQQVIGMAHWFMTGTQQTPPPRWKVATVTWLGIFPTVLLLFTLIGDILAQWPLVPRVMCLTGLVVLIMTWIVAPQLTRWLKPWLHAGHKH